MKLATKVLQPEIMMVDISKLKPSPIRSELTNLDLLIAAYTFKHAGYLFCNTLEQWELGFMRDSNPRKELGWWLCACYMLKKVKPVDLKEEVVKVIAGEGSPDVMKAFHEGWDRIEDLVREALLKGGDD